MNRWKFPGAGELRSKTRRLLRRLTKAEDIANSVAFLASDTVARQITGQLITVSGGFAMR